MQERRQLDFIPWEVYTDSQYPSSFFIGEKWTLYVRDDGKLVYHYNFFDLERYEVVSDRKVPTGSVVLRCEFLNETEVPGRSATVTLLIDDEPVDQGRVEATEPMIFSGDETTDVGGDSATPVSDDYGPKDSAFTGRVDWVQIDIDEAAEDFDYLITPEERLRVAMARQ
jgi:arylsulfatase